MTTKAKELVRIPITVSFYDENNKVAHYASSNIKTKIRTLTSSLLAKNANLRMECKVLYSKKQDSWNKFEFNSMADFDRKLNPCLEIELLRELLKDGMVDKKNMEKRKR